MNIKYIRTEEKQYSYSNIKYLHTYIQIIAYICVPLNLNALYYCDQTHLAWEHEVSIGHSNKQGTFLYKVTNSPEL